MLHSFRACNYWNAGVAWVEASEESINDQLGAVEEYCQRKRYTLVGTYPEFAYNKQNHADPAQIDQIYVQRQKLLFVNFLPIFVLNPRSFHVVAFLASQIMSELENSVDNWIEALGEGINEELIRSVIANKKHLLQSTDEQTKRKCYRNLLIK